jgi:hypothetical protein
MKIQTLKNFIKIFGAIQILQFEGFQDIKDFKSAMKEVD